jgi:hypothetical protein
MPRVGPKPLVTVGMLVAAGAMVWLTRLGPHTGYVDGVLGPLILTGIGLGMVIAPSINTGTYGVGQQLGASIGTSLLNTIFAGAVASYLTAHAVSARVLGRQARGGLALAHGYDTAFWWTTGIFAAGALVGGILLRPGPLYQQDPASPQPAGVTPARTEAGPAISA